MLRASFFSAGLFVCLWGMAFLHVDKIVMHNTDEKLQRDENIRGMLSNQQIEKEIRRIIDPPDWAAFSLLSAGAVTMLYAVALPRKD
ncbi:MAG: hypothetical protein U0872_14040 [Planctomycetaceae bacterium]